MEEAGKVHVLTDLPPGTFPRYTVNGRLVGPQDRSEVLTEEKNLFNAVYRSRNFWL